jgi:hypothetical protein
MRYLIPEIASSIGFGVTLVLFLGFMMVFWKLVLVPSKTLDEASLLPLEED